MELPVLDRAGALERIGDDVELYQEILELFLSDTPEQVIILRQALESQDRVLGQRQAHSLKSASANIGAERMRHACLQCEKVFASASFDDLAQKVKDIEDSLKELQAHLAGN